MQTLDIPQANDLDTVRQVLHAVWRGARSLDAIADFTTYSTRHTQYRVHAARVLGLAQIVGDEVVLTTLGDRLLATDWHSAAEREIYTRAIEGCEVIQTVAPDLLGRRAPDIEDLSERLFRQSRLGPETARRRANGLLAWRRHVLGETLSRPARHPAQGPTPVAAKAPSPTARSSVAARPAPSPPSAPVGGQPALALGPARREQPIERRPRRETSRPPEPGPTSKGEQLSLL